MVMVAKFQPHMVKIRFAEENVANLSLILLGKYTFAGLHANSIGSAVSISVSRQRALTHQRQALHGDRRMAWSNAWVNRRKRYRNQHAAIAFQRVPQRSFRSHLS
jgi:hypothetical protein